MSLYLSVVIPCYNEEKNLHKGVLLAIKEYLESKKFSWEVIVSDDGSTDKSRELIRNQIRNYPNFRLLKNLHGGKPSALWAGIKEAKGKYILFTDMDQSTPMDQLHKLLPFLGRGVGSVIGSRGLVRKNYPVYRRLGSIIFVSVRKLAILPEVSDTQCGFKLFRKSVVEKAFPRLEFFKKQIKARGWTVTSFDVELLHIIKKMGYMIEEVPVLWEDKDISESKGGGIGRYFKESKEMLSQIIRVKMNDMRGLYET